MSDQRLFAVAAWRDAPYFTDAERAALALTEAVTRVADRGEPVSDEVWAEAARHYDEQGLSGLLIAITAINVWNRLNAATRQVAGAWA
jgi:alkylhydroperoxidase family enzyme